MQQLLSVLNRIYHAKILVIGDVILDNYIYGDVARISPEAPVPVVNVTNRISMLGGAGNVVCNISALGASPVIVSLSGKDDGAQKISKMLADIDCRSYGMGSSSTRQTSIKSRVVARGQQLMRLDEESVQQLSSQEEDRLKAALNLELQKNKVVVLSDYKKGVLSPALVHHCIELSKSLGIKSIVDPKGHDFSCYSNADIATPNVNELRLATNKPVETDAQIVEASRHLISTYNIDTILVTRGERGMTLVTQTTVNHIQTNALEVFDVSGAGDTVVAMLACCCAIDEVTILEAATLANIAAGAVVGKLGTASVSVREIEEFIISGQGKSANQAFYDFEEATNKVSEWHQQGKIVGFTNGCFDILHPGHISLLKKAKSLCDKLIVGINTDESVARLKGPERPINSVNDRAQVISEMQSVDLVVTFHQDTPLELIRAFKPKVLIKGADYTADQVVGAKETIRNGGAVHLVDLVEGVSSSDTIKTIRAQSNT